MITIWCVDGAGTGRILSANGSLNLIYPYQQKTDLINVAEKYDLYPAKYLILRGNKNKEPNRIIVEFKFEETNVKTEELCIRELTNEYTEEYKQLTKDYYL